MEVEDRTYLVTGAFGSLGQEVARLLVKRGARRLILMGRTPLPARSEWSTPILQSPIVERIDFIRELEALGVQVQIAAIDIMDSVALFTYMEAYESSGWPPIGGLVHSAGAVKDTILTQMDAGTFDQAYEPKVKGAWLLHEALKQQPLEFFILFSSLAALLPPTGQGNYAAGNTFMDALAAYRRSIGLPGLSINWGPWSIGMVDKLHLTDYFQANGIDCITPGEGMRLLEHLIGQDYAQIAVLSAEWKSVRRMYPGAMLLNLLDKTNGEQSEQDDGGLSFLLKLSELDFTEREFALKEHFVSLIAELLHFGRSELYVLHAG